VGAFQTLRPVAKEKEKKGGGTKMVSKNITGQLHEWHPTARWDLDGPDDHDFVGLDTPFPDTPFRDLVLQIHLGILEESIHRSPDVLCELGQSNGIALRS
jgi:hypothetical protein